MTRVGKVARLPRILREQLNRRLQDGETGKRLVGWLNTLPEVKAMLAVEFDGRAINEQNLSEWKTGGYHDWEKHQEQRALLMQLTEAAEDLEAADKTGRLNRHLSVVLSADLAQTTREVLAQTSDAKDRLKYVGQAVGKFAQLRREESSAERVRLLREHWQAEQKKVEAKGKTNHALFPIHAAILHKSFMGMLAGSSPQSQTDTAQVLTRLLERRKKTQTVTNPPADKVSPAQFKPVQGQPSHVGAAEQTKTDQIKPNQT